MRAFFAAVQFLTILPVPWSGEKELGRSVSWFPFVGLIIGVFVAALDYGLFRLFPPLTASVLTVIALIGVSGGLHLDGLADTADGFLSSRPRERVLEIMKDSRIGTMGAAAIVCLIALKIAALSSVPAPLRIGTLVMVPIAGRCALVMTMAILPYARPEGGLGSAFHARVIHVVWALVVLLAVGWLALRWTGLISGMLSFAVALVLAVYSYRRIGGFTGDVLGAACEIVEVVPILTASSLAHLH